MIATTTSSSMSVNAMADCLGRSTSVPGTTQPPEYRDPAKTNQQQARWFRYEYQIGPIVQCGERNDLGIERTIGEIAADATGRVSDRGLAEVYLSVFGTDGDAQRYIRMTGGVGNQGSLVIA